MDRVTGIKEGSGPGGVHARMGSFLLERNGPAKIRDHRHQTEPRRGSGGLDRIARDVSHGLLQWRFRIINAALAEDGELPGGQAGWILSRVHAHPNISALALWADALVGLVHVNTTENMLFVNHS